MNAGRAEIHAAIFLLLVACAPPVPSTSPPSLVISASALGREGYGLRALADRFAAENPGISIEIQPAADAADQRHQLYVQWLNAQTPTPDILQLDVIWTPEFAAAGWLAPIDLAPAEARDFFAPALQANTVEQTLYALPWFVDVGMLYWRTDLLREAPGTWDALMAEARAHGGFVFPGARYEGLVTAYLEVLGAWGGAILDEKGRVTVDSREAIAALGTLRACVQDGSISSSRVLSWHEEETRFAFQNGSAALMRNWPYAWPLMNEPSSSIRGKFAVAPMPSAPGGSSTAALGGSQLAINAASRNRDLALRFIRFLTSPGALIEKAKTAGQYPPRRSVYENGALDGVLPIPPAQVKAIIERATPRPVTPLYTELSSELQVALHAALSGQLSDEAALHQAADKMRAIMARTEIAPSRPLLWPWMLGMFLVVTAIMFRAVRSIRALDVPGRREALAAVVFLVPGITVMALVTLVPLAVTMWEALHRHDLRTPWVGTPWSGFANFTELFTDTRFLEALLHSVSFAFVSVLVELVVGTALALALNEAFRGRLLLRSLVLLPWAVPTVVAALIWRFLFDASVGPEIFAKPLLAWIPVVIGDVWKTVPFVALLLLAALQGLDPSLYEAARLDGASAFQRLTRITLPILRPTMAVVVLFRSLDALRVFDLIYVMTGGGPGTATEPLAFYAFNTLLQNLRFGYGSAISITIFALTALVATIFVKVLGADVTGRRS